MTEVVDVTVTPVEVDVPSGSLGGWVMAPAAADATRPRALLYCLAGGSCTTGYFDLQPPGLASYSMARHLAGRGLLVAALDHPGIGRSAPVEDRYALTPGVVAAAHAAAVEQLRRRLGADVVVGVGHSMGGMVVDVQQARHGSFDRIAVLGTSDAGVPEVLTTAERGLTGRPWDEVTDELVALARLRFGPGSTVERKAPVRGVFFAPDVPAAARAALAAQRTDLLPTCGLTAMIPGTTSADRAAVDVPVLVAFGEHDLGSGYADGRRRYPSATVTASFELAGSGHCHNLAGRRVELWDRLDELARQAISPAPSPARCTASGSG